MIGNQNKKNKDNLIDIHAGYVANKGTMNDGIDAENLKRQVEGFSKDKFTLAVAGEVSAGKSTFINALLGAEILPSDLKQTSNAIVEICHSEKVQLHIEYANNRSEVISGDASTGFNNVTERLREICQVDNRYRKIPTNIIDEQIKENGNIVLDEEFLDYLRDNSKYNSLIREKDTIQKYLEERTIDKIPVKIEFSYPLNSLQELSVVDTPGVNATGGVQILSYAYLKNSDAIVFVQKIEDVEKESFRDFVDSVISDKSKNMLFLVLTHAGKHSSTDIEDLFDVAQYQYEDIISEDRILVVDSLAEIIVKDLSRGLTKDDIENTSEQKSIFLAPFEKKAKKENTTLIKQLENASRFEKLIEVIGEFSSKASNLQFKAIIQQIKSGYAEQEKQYEDKTKLLEAEKEDPQLFNQEIKRIHDSLREYKNLMKRTKISLEGQYSGVHSSWVKDVQLIRAKYPELNSKSTTIDNVRKNTVDGLDAAQAKLDEFVIILTEELTSALQKADKTFGTEHNISIPKVDLNALEHKAKQKSYYDEDIYTKRKNDVLDYATFFISKLFRDNKVKTGSKKVFDKSKHISIYKDECNNEFYRVMDSLEEDKGEILKCYLESFEREINDVIYDRQRELDFQKKKKQTNASLTDQMKVIKTKIKKIRPEEVRCDDLIEEVSW